MTDGLLLLESKTQHALILQGLARLYRGHGHYTALALATGIWGEAILKLFVGLSHGFMALGSMWLWFKPIAWIGYALGYVIQTLQSIIRQLLLRSQVPMFFKADRQVVELGYGDALKKFLQHQTTAQMITLPGLKNYVTPPPAPMLRVDRLERVLANKAV